MTIFARGTGFLFCALLAGCTATKQAGTSAIEPAPPPPAKSVTQPGQFGESTRILSQRDADRLLQNKGLTLQWIDWNTRGTAIVTRREGLWQLSGAQAEAGGPGRLFLKGHIVEIGEGYFTFRGAIRIAGTPDRDRACEADKDWHFAVTQNRPYYRLREFEWCDGLTDYIDIYF